MTLGLQAEDFHCWCGAEPKQPCQPQGQRHWVGGGGTEADPDQELQVARWHQDRMRTARDANAALRPRVAELRAALREALDHWKVHMDHSGTMPTSPQYDRIAELRELLGEN